LLFSLEVLPIRPADADGLTDRTPAAAKIATRSKPVARDQPLTAPTPHCRSR
jgi:hypothetical protein